MGDNAIKYICIYSQNHEVVKSIILDVKERKNLSSSSTQST